MNVFDNKRDDKIRNFRERLKSNNKRIVMRLNLEFCKSFLKMTKLYLTMMFLTPDVSQEIWQAPLFEHCNKTRKLTKIALECHFN